MFVALMNLVNQHSALKTTINSSLGLTRFLNCSNVPKLIKPVSSDSNIVLFEFYNPFKFFYYYFFLSLSPFMN